MKPTTKPDMMFGAFRKQIGMMARGGGVNLAHWMDEERRKGNLIVLTEHGFSIYAPKPKEA